MRIRSLLALATALGALAPAGVHSETGTGAGREERLVDETLTAGPAFAPSAAAGLGFVAETYRNPAR